MGRHGRSVAKKCPKREILSHSLQPEAMRVSKIEFSLSGNTARTPAGQGRGGERSGGDACESGGGA